MVRGGTMLTFIIGDSRDTCLLDSFSLFFNVNTFFLRLGILGHFIFAFFVRARTGLVAVLTVALGFSNDLGFLLDCEFGSGCCFPGCLLSLFFVSFL
jgi:hypothetical protein